MKCSDIPDLLVLAAVKQLGQTSGTVCVWTFRWDIADTLSASGVEFPGGDGDRDRLMLAKLKRLVDRGLLDGCPCGCRGDFELTPTGRAALEATPTTVNVQRRYP